MIMVMHQHHQLLALLVETIKIMPTRMRNPTICTRTMPPPKWKALVEEVPQGKAVALCVGGDGVHCVETSWTA
jgi:hypothetical protein